ncbi:hypothetical protein [Burkholderia pseudomallei]|uniref:hypothetical protein n=1 Tax=Burkholderia pseudomallei TaxID=28450 RepID=UPI0007DB1BC4|nr:hypothetical protein [Burkholderia pseudomallei]MBO2982763.1 hypothetical protein [Burkholderia pseudomallei]MBO7915093.1 hypothetical protein [Burkholderia pseudomallei]QTB50071.1 hypothetical protein J3C54_05715 [Burkholderia pseudomallei]
MAGGRRCDARDSMRNDGCDRADPNANRNVMPRGVDKATKRQSDRAPRRGFGKAAAHEQTACAARPGGKAERSIAAKTMLYNQVSHVWALAKLPW